MPDVQRVMNLLEKYSTNDHPSIKISLLRLAIIQAMSIAPEYREELKAMRERLKVISSQANWPAFQSYLLAGRWEAVEDNEAFVYFDLLTEMDGMADALMALVEKIKKKRKKEMLEKFFEEVMK